MRATNHKTEVENVQAASLKVTDYSRFGHIDGTHPFQQAVPDGYVAYQARTRHGGKVAYFNFHLAKEMGLIAEDHPLEMTPELEKAILHTFAIQIINEYDIIHKTKFPAEDIRPNMYMATRYLQLQHPDKNGTTSGDGRSIWNGCITTPKGVTWDVSSCGTGATRLSPATAIEGRFFKTGSRVASYGCGCSDVGEGLAAAVMSEIFHRNGLGTERTLAIIEFEKGQSVNVRAAKNLLRPSHFFHHLKQSNYPRLKAAIDFFIERQYSNGEWKRQADDEKRYKEMARSIAVSFAKMCARYEAEYIFVWLDWDGDNVLANGGIIDYGSVRQFGLYHHEYRYDDVERWSTTIPEQKKKAREIVQTFCQIRDYLITKEKPSRGALENDAMLKLFDRVFEDELLRITLYKVGFNKKQCEYLFNYQRKLVKKFKLIHSYFEKAKSSKGIRKTEDGVTHDAIYCMRDILRELPLHILQKRIMPSDAEFMNMIASSYANKKERTVTPAKAKKIHEFKSLYLKLLEKAAENFELNLDKVLLEVSMRSSIINKSDRITGDSIISVTDKIVRTRKELGFEGLMAVVENFVDYQRRVPTPDRKRPKPKPIEGKGQDVFKYLLKIVSQLKESI